MNHHTTADTASGASAAGALVSLFTFILSFFNSTHIWLQNLTLLVSLFAGLFAICAGAVRLVIWIKKLFAK